MLAEVADGVLTSVITGTGKWFATSAASGLRRRSVRRDAEIAQWFDTYELTARAFPDPPDGASAAAVASWLGGADVHAVLHELLAVRMTGGPEADIDRLRALLSRSAGAVFPAAVAGPLAVACADWADAEVRALVTRLESRDPKRWRAARTDAFGARTAAILGAIERHTAALDTAADPAADAVWVTRYRAQAVRLYGSVEPPDFTRRHKVPVDDLYVPPDIVDPDALRDPSGVPAPLAFDTLVGRIDRTVLLGDPGGGKSTAIQVIAHRWAADPAARVPFVVVLREFAAGDDGPVHSVAEHIEDRLRTRHQCTAPEGTVERLLLSGTAAVLFDGLDELVDTGRRLEVTRIVEQFCERYPLAPVLVTSRVVGYDEARLDDEQYTRYVVAGFDDERTRAYVRNWFAHGDDRADGAAGDPADVADTFMAESTAVADLRSNPLMLAYLCVLYRGAGTLPRDRPGVYAKCAEMLLDLWDARRSVTIHLRARNHLEPALRAIAFWLFTRDGGAEVTEQELVAFTAGHLHRNAYEHQADAEAAAREFVAFCRGRAWILSDAGTTARGDALYRFTHRTFLEYFTAYAIAASCDTPERLARTLVPRIARAEWEVVAQLALQIKGHTQSGATERFFTALLGEKRRRSVAARGNVLAFLARGLAFADPPPRVSHDLTRSVISHFTDGDPDDAGRYRAAVDLIRHASAAREAVANELAAAAERMISNGGQARERAVRWLTALGSPIMLDAMREEDVRYWESWAARLRAEWCAAIGEVAHVDDGVWVTALLSFKGFARSRCRVVPPVLTPREALGLRERVPAPMVQWGTRAGAFGCAWAPLGLIMLRDLASDEDLRELGLAKCADFGAWLADRRPPFVEAPVDSGWAEFRPDKAWSVISCRIPPGETYLGAAMALATIAECAPPGRIEPADLGLPEELAPYLRRDTGNLPGLPIPPRFQELFRRWARGEVRFVEVVPESAAT